MIGYRKSVVIQNLKNSFPSKSDEEIKKLCSKYYHYLCDLIVETIKTLSISPSVVRKHFMFEGQSLFESYRQKNQSVIIVMGHYGNWELGGARFTIEHLHRLFVVYKPLKSKAFDKLTYRMRTRLGTKLYAMNETLRGMISDKNELTATAFIADQTPFPENAYWTTFLNQDTPFFTGNEKIARKLNYPVIYVSIDRIKRGLYNLKGEVLAEHPAATGENEITEAFARRLEKDIVAKPEIWLWSHRRWKHKRG